jgi:hypothetical protein
VHLLLEGGGKMEVFDLPGHGCGAIQKKLKIMIPLFADGPSGSVRRGKREARGVRTWRVDEI